MLRLHSPLDTEQTNTLRCAETPVVESVTAEACQNPSKYLKTKSSLCSRREKTLYKKGAITKQGSHSIKVPLSLSVDLLKININCLGNYHKDWMW